MKKAWVLVHAMQLEKGTREIQYSRCGGGCRKAGPACHGVNSPKLARAELSFSWSAAERFHPRYTILSMLLLSLLGCGRGLPDRVPVSGTVLIDGKPLTSGSIMLIPTNERPAGGSISPEGRFTLSCYERDDGVVPGTHKVTVQAVEHLSLTESRWLVPPKYGDPATSALEVTIDGPTDDLVINLTWDGGKPFVQRF